MRSKILILFCTFLWALESGAQIFKRDGSGSTFRYGHCLKEVHFGGIPNTNYIPITKDDSSGEYDAPQFVKTYPGGCDVSNGNIVEQEPVAYVRGIKARVKACFLSDCTHSYYIRGMGPPISGGQIVFPMQMVTPSGGQVIYDWMDASIPFVLHKVKYFENFTIKWQLSEDGTNWEDIDESVNTLYVTYDVPIIGISYGLGTYKVRHSSIHFSCLSANNKTNKNDIVQAIHDNYFSNLDCTDVSGDLLTYWGNQNNSSCVGLEDFFTSNDGTCGTWSFYNQEMLLIHGINSILTAIFPNPESMTSNEQIAYRNQFITHFGTSNVWVFPDYLFLVKKWDINIDYYDLGSDPDKWQHAPGLKGVEAQNNQDPTSIFGDHAFISYNNKFYDPSYGQYISSGKLKDYEDMAIEIVEGVFFKVGTTPNPNGPGTFYIYKSQVNTINLPELTKTP